MRRKKEDRRGSGLLQEGKTPRAVWDAVSSEGLASGNEYAWMHVSEDGRQVLCTYVRMLASPNTVSKRLKLTGLCPDARYRSEEDGRIYTGRELMNVGLSPGKSGPTPTPDNGYCSKLRRQGRLVRTDKSFRPRLRLMKGHSGTKGVKIRTLRTGALQWVFQKQISITG